MPITSPDFLPMPWAAQGQTITIPQAKPENGRASWEQGFPPETSMPKQAGGIPPHRLDMQGALTALSKHIFFQQSGSIYPWNAALDYMAGAHVVGTDGVEYVAIQASGANEGAGAQNPVNDALRQYWQPLKLNLVDLIYPVGSIVELANSTNPNTIWSGTTWQQLEAGRMTIAAGGAYPLGSRGGNAQVTLTTNQLPAHSHAGSTSTAGTHSHSGETTQAGAHAHGRGSMNITGVVQAHAAASIAQNETTGAFYNPHYYGRNIDTGGGNGDGGLGFDASRSWTGQTSTEGTHKHSLVLNTAGAHTHTVTVGNTGGGQAVNILNPYLAVNKWQRIA